MVCVHASNVCGTVLPIRKIGRLAKSHGAAFLVDAAQSAGVLPIDVGKDRIDFLCVPGHKGLLGPQGTGFLYFRDGTELKTLMEGGTGSQSDRPEMPSVLPDRFQAGTQNTPGVAGLREGVRFVRTRLPEIRQRETEWTEAILRSLGSMEEVRLYGPADLGSRVSVISFNIAGMDPAEVGNRLEQKFGISCRVGLHCAPAAHRSIGTFPQGTVRVSPGYFTAPSEIRSFLSAVERTVRGHGKPNQSPRQR
jgi:selenocysteine lyase/cysteine desulfurase